MIRALSRQLAIHASRMQAYDHHCGFGLRREFHHCSTLPLLSRFNTSETSYFARQFIFSFESFISTPQDADEMPRRHAGLPILLRPE